MCVFDCFRGNRLTGEGTIMTIFFMKQL
uniref:Uncharacterized protein n=1 Tax=Anguilla anguilla TaxID=7936 RepID=A0A0E9PDQ4_ANGAN